MTDVPEAPAAPAVDLTTVLAEIREEVAQRRAAGELAPNLERELDVLFAKLAPAGAIQDDFNHVLERLESASFLSLDVPVLSNVPGGTYVKKTESKLLAWYMRFVTEQVADFGAILARALKVLDSRLTELERAAKAHDVPDAFREPLPTHMPDLDPWKDLIPAALTDAPGRVLQAECGDAAFVATLADAGADAYGVDPDDDMVLAACAGGLDIRTDTATDHLAKLADGVLGGIVLTSCVDTLDAQSQYKLAELAVHRLRAGGKLVVAATDPAAWPARAPAVVADLAPGRPLHPETWQRFLGRLGLTDVTVERSETAYLVIGVQHR